jgi:hypothetical protein
VTLKPLVQHSAYALIFGPGEISIRLGETSPAKLSAEESVAWDKARSERRGLFDSLMLEVERLECGELWVRPASYRAFIAARQVGKRRMRALAVSGFMTDGMRLVTGRRPRHVTQYPGRVEAVPSGSIDRIEPDGTIDSRKALLAELEEEAGLIETEDAVDAPLLILDRMENIVDVCHPIRPQRGLDDAVRKARAVGYYGEVACRDLAALSDAVDELVPTTLAIVHFLLGVGPFAHAAGHAR